jgi:hypothetical protein
MNRLRAGMSAAPLSAKSRRSLSLAETATIGPKAVVRFCLQNAARRGQLRFPIASCPTWSAIFALGMNSEGAS